jgi:hypothetical protein
MESQEPPLALVQSHALVPVALAVEVVETAAEPAQAAESCTADETAGSVDVSAEIDDVAVVAAETAVAFAAETAEIAVVEAAHDVYSCLQHLPR